MGVFGDNLRRERELRGIALTEISESTKIAKRWLKALEDEQFEALPGGVFNRGFVRAYARFLGLNEERTVADYIAASKEQPPAEDVFPLEIHEKPKSPPLNPKRSAAPLVLAAAGLLCLAGGWAWWIKHRPKSIFPPAATAEMAAPSSVASPALLEPVSQADAGKSQGAANQDERASNDGDSAHGRASTALTADEPSTPAVQTLQGPINVVIKARQNSWISIAADGRTLWQGILNAHKERAASADKQLVIRTGNAAGIEVSYNGKELGTLGKDKEVRTVTFNTSGLQQ